MSKHIKSYKSFCESVSQSKIDNILDKISEHGIESLSEEEKQLLAQSNDGIDDSEKATFDVDGDLTIDGEKVNKREPITEWSRDVNDEVEEYLFSNFRRQGTEIYDNLELEISIPEVINRVKNFFNCYLPEVDALVKDWSNKGVSLKENKRNKFKK